VRAPVATVASFFRQPTPSRTTVLSRSSCSLLKHDHTRTSFSCSLESETKFIFAPWSRKIVNDPGFAAFGATSLFTSA
jgi:hypothetical protein